MRCRSQNFWFKIKVGAVHTFFSWTYPRDRGQDHRILPSCVDDRLYLAPCLCESVGHLEHLAYSDVPFRYPYLGHVVSLALCPGPCVGLENGHGSLFRSLYHGFDFAFYVHRRLSSFLSCRVPWNEIVGIAEYEEYRSTSCANCKTDVEQHLVKPSHHLRLANRRFIYLHFSFR